MREYRSPLNLSELLNSTALNNPMGSAMYGKVFRQMFKGTLASRGPWQAIVTFQQMIVLADQDGVVDMTPDAIHRETTIPLDIINVGISALEQPDASSRTPDEDGRRIVRLRENSDWGWRIVNYAKYRAMKSEEERREYHRQYWHKRKKKTQTDSTNSIHAEAEAEAEAEETRSDSSPLYQSSPLRSSPAHPDDLHRVTETKRLTRALANKLRAGP